MNGNRWVSITLLLASACGRAPDRTDDDTTDVNETPLEEQCPGFEVRARPLAELPEGLAPANDLPLPSQGPDADGWFHPPAGYVEGGYFPAPAERPEWAVDPGEVAAPAPPGSLRVVEWNVERGNELDEAIRLMKRVNADVWVLNEADLYGRNSGDVVVAREIARALGYSYFTGIEFYERREDRRGTSGNALVSRHPMSDGRWMSVPMFEELGGHDWAESTSEPRCGQRSALSARIDAPLPSGEASPIRVVALHTENKSNRTVRRMQFEASRDALVSPGEPTIVAGDLNTIGIGEGPGFRKYLKQIWAAEGPAGALFDCSRGDDGFTFSKFIVQLRIDWMLVQPGTGGRVECPAGSYRVLDNDGASDHLPVLTEMHLN